MSNYKSYERTKARRSDSCRSHRRAKKKNPTSVRTLTARVQQHISEDNLEAARMVVGDCIRMGRNNIHLTQAANIAFREKKFTKAQQYLRDSLNLDPENPYALSLMGDVLRQQGKLDEAVSYYERAATYASEEIHVRIVYGKIVKAYLESEQNEKALEVSAQKLEMDAEDPVSWISHCAVLGRLKRYEDVLESAEKAIALSPQKPAAWFHKHFALINLKRYEDALETSSVLMNFVA